MERLPLPKRSIKVYYNTETKYYRLVFVEDNSFCTKFWRYEEDNTDVEKEFWLPNNKISYVKIRKDGSKIMRGDIVLVEIPDWLAEQENLNGGLYREEIHAKS